MRNSPWLPNDWARCPGTAAQITESGEQTVQACPQRETCLRFLAPMNGSDLFAVMMFGNAETMGDCPDYIEYKPDAKQ